MRNGDSRHPLLRLLAVAAIIVSSCIVATPQAVQASHTPSPTSVSLVGDLESEATATACGDWDPGCAAAQFGAQGNDVFVFQSATIPANSYAVQGCHQRRLG